MYVHSGGGGMQNFSMAVSEPPSSSLKMSRLGGCYISKLAAALIAFFLLAAIGIAIFFTIVHFKDRYGEAGGPEEWMTGRRLVALRDTVVPIHYNLQLVPVVEPVKPFLVNKTLLGHVHIFIRADLSTDCIEFHSAGLQFDPSHLKIIATGSHNVTINKLWNKWTGPPFKVEGEQRELSVLEVACSSKAELCRVRLDGYVSSRLSGLILLSLPYTVPITQSRTGIYFQHYFDKFNNKTKWFVATRTMPVFGRRLFPCFDQPSFRSTFDVSILRHPDLTSISNSHIWTSEIWSKEWVWDRYHKTSLMSASSLSMVVGDLAVVHLSDLTTEICLWSQPALINHTVVTAHLLPIVFKKMEVLTHSALPLSQLDVVILPGLSSLSNGWGLITLDESEVLSRGNERSDLFEYSTARLVSLQMALQWLGDLPAPAWSHLWLHASLASYLAHSALQYIHEGWDGWAEFIANNKPEAMLLDSCKLATPLNTPPKVVEALALQYQNAFTGKGVLVLYMLFNALFARDIREVFKNYIACNRKSPDINDCSLWPLMDGAMRATNLSRLAEAGITFSSLYPEWFCREGYPSLTVHLDQLSNTVVIRQKSTCFIKQWSDEKFWSVPVKLGAEVLGGRAESRSVWLKAERESGLRLAHRLSTLPWVVANIDATGYYRLNYGLANWESLLEGLRGGVGAVETVVGPAGRGQLVDDAMSSARTSSIPYPAALRFLSYLTLAEAAYPPWRVTLYHLHYIHMFLWDHPDAQHFKVYMFNLMKPLYMTLKFGTIENHLHAELRNMIVLSLCQLEMPQCQDWAKVVFDNWKKDNSWTTHIQDTKVAESLKHVVYCSAVQSEGEAAWSLLRETYLSPNTSRVEKQVLIRALACTTIPPLIDSILNSCLEEVAPGEYLVPEYDAIELWTSFLKNPPVTNQIFEFFRMNHMPIYERFRSSPELLHTMVLSLAKSLSREIHISDLNFLKQSLDSDSELRSYLTEAEVVVERNVAWRRAHLITVAEWFKGSGPLPNETLPLDTTEKPY